MLKLSVFLFLLLIIPSIAFAVGGQATTGSGGGAGLSAADSSNLSTTATSTSAISARTPPLNAVTVTSLSVTATVTSGTLLAANPLRGGCTIINRGSEEIYVDFSGAVATSIDTVVLPLQSRFCSDLGLVPSGAITVLSSAGSQSVSVVEVSR